jgi:hypothetical protein
VQHLRRFRDVEVLSDHFAEIAELLESHRY